MDDAELGTLTQHGDTWQLVFTRRLSHPREKVWRAVTEPEHLAAWFPDQIVGPMQAGAQLRFVMPHDPDDGFDGEMLTFDPPSVMELRWGTDYLRIELQADDGATVLTLTDTIGELGKAARDAAGWHECLDRLVAHLDGATAPEPGEAWRDVNPLYVERFGPDAATIGPPEGWDATG
jgi:uncharacterized protein YndB with AHSA1/START domain